MQYMAPPQYSPDGQWWWNGRSWVRVTWAVQGRSSPWTQQQASDARSPDPRPYDDSLYEEDEPRRRTPAVLWVGLIALAALLLLAFGASFVNWASLQGLGLGGRAAPSTPATAAPATAAPTTAPTAAPPATASGTDAYRQVVAADVGRFQAAGQTVSDRCSAAALSQGTGACRAALRSMDDTVQGFQADLAGVRVPACLQTANTELRTALSQYHQGIRQELDGLDHQDLAAIAQGGATLSDATNHAQAAGQLFQNSC